MPRPARPLYLITEPGNGARGRIFPGHGVLWTLVVLAAAVGVAHAEPTVAARTGPPTGVAIGVELGQPSTVTVRWATGCGARRRRGVGTGTPDGTGLTQIHGGVSVRAGGAGGHLAPRSAAVRRRRRAPLRAPLRSRVE
ncbi:MAG: hypothetical protein IPL61_31060 [Myxococcales bacterium]|nr:hypothetical protein [Myxococcales bacterium]